MSLPNYLAKIKSAGVYRFVWDKSVVPAQQAETLRLLVGYSEKGPFNTPVYIESVSDFKSIFGNISKRLERKGVYFHRMAEQALASGPILALNLKPFTDETVGYTSFNGKTVDGKQLSTYSINVNKLYDTNRFWKLDENQLPEKLEGDAYFNIATTDVKDNSCSIFIQKNKPESYKGITFGSWYSSQGEEYPEYMSPILNDQMDDYFADIYVFRGEFTNEICGGPLKKYFEPKTVTKYREASEDEINNEEVAKYVTEDGGETYREVAVGDEAYTKYVKEDVVDHYELISEYENIMGQKIPGIEALAADSNSNFIGLYSGCTVPYFKDANGNYISLDIKFNSDYGTHKMMMKFDDAILEGLTAEGLRDSMTIKEKIINNGKEEIIRAKRPTYLPGYVYHSISKDTQSSTIWSQCKKMISSENKGILEALTNRVDVEYHYIVDTFDSETGENKGELFLLAQTKDNAFAIVNFPKMSKFGNSENVKKTFNMPAEIDGASFGAYYTQLTFSDGVVKNIIPSAALVSNLFMAKWTTRQPYYIVAGPNYSVLSYTGLVGPDYNFSRADLDILEPMGINAIIYVPRLGTYISSNQTAKQVPVSGLSKVHIRELVIYLQDEIEYLLQSYQWELNTQPLRDTIKAKADSICENIQNNGGLYAFVNICDETNNTAEVIDNEMIILDTEIEPARGAGKMIHQLTIHKTGALSSTIK